MIIIVTSLFQAFRARPPRGVQDDRPALLERKEPKEGDKSCQHAMVHPEDTVEGALSPSLSLFLSLFFIFL